jgi:hypothetical protein
MNSTPAASIAARNFCVVSSRPPSSPSAASSRATVGSEIPEQSDKSACDQASSALAAFICLVVTKKQSLSLMELCPNIRPSSRVCATLSEPPYFSGYSDHSHDDSRCFLGEFWRSDFSGKRSRGVPGAKRQFCGVVVTTGARCGSTGALLVNFRFGAHYTLHIAQVCPISGLMHRSNSSVQLVTVPMLAAASPILAPTSSPAPLRRSRAGISR